MIEPQTLLFLNNALHVLERRELNPEYKDLDNDQMSFAERVVLDSLLRGNELSDVADESENWNRMRWIFGELQELADLNDFVAYVFFSEYLAQELLASLEEKGFFFKKKSDAFAEKLRKNREFFTTYDDAFQLSLMLKPLRQKEQQYIERSHEDPEDTRDHYLFSEGCIDLCIIKYKEKLMPLLESYLSKYLQDFQSTDTHWDENIFKWEKQYETAKPILLKREEKFGNHFWLSKDDIRIINKLHGTEFRFIETLLVMQSMGELKVYFDCPNIIRGNETALNIEIIKGAHATKEASTDTNLFRYGNSITDCESHYIWKDGDKENGQKFNNKTKRRYIWEFCRKVCDQGFKTQEEIDKYVSEKTGQNDHVSTDDMKAFLSVIEHYSDVSLKELRSSYITFKEGKGIEVKKIP